VRCKYHKIPHDNWVCDGCGGEFDRLEEYFEVATGPDVDDVLEAPEVSLGVRVVPLIYRFRRVCRECYSRFGSAMYA
jgi:hypothetical protein